MSSSSLRFLLVIRWWKKRSVFRIDSVSCFLLDSASQGGALVSLIHAYTENGDPFARSFTDAVLEEVGLSNFAFFSFVASFSHILPFLSFALSGLQTLLRLPPTLDLPRRTPRPVLGVLRSSQPRSCRQAVRQDEALPWSRRCWIRGWWATRRCWEWSWDGESRAVGEEVSV